LVIAQRPLASGTTYDRVRVIAAAIAPVEVALKHVFVGFLERAAKLDQTGAP